MKVQPAASSLAAREELFDFVKALASENRQRILFDVFLGGGEYSVSEIARRIRVGQPTVSEHLAILRRAGILRAERRGKETFYRPDRSEIVRRLKSLTALFECCQ